MAASVRGLSPGEAVRFACKAAASGGLALGFLDVALSLGPGLAPGLHPLGVALASVVASGASISLVLLVVLLPFALRTGKEPGSWQGARLVALAIGMGTFLGTATAYNLIRFELKPHQAKTLVLAACLALAIGALHYDRSRLLCTGSRIPMGLDAGFLALPFLLAYGFLFKWGWSFRRSRAPEDWPWMWVAVFSITAIALVLSAIAIARRGWAGRGLFALALLVIAAPASRLLSTDGRRPPVLAPIAAHAIRKVVLLTVDTLRADAISVLNSVASPTPSLDTLASDSVVFARAYSPSSWTLPAFVSMMTGVTPPVHGVKSPSLRIPEGLTTLAERMRDAGYMTAAIGHNPWLRPQHGMSRGFGTYDICPRNEYGESLGSRLLARFFPGRRKPTLTTPEITRFARAWLREHAGDDFFLWVHYFKPHGPYEPPVPYRPKEAPPAGMGYRFGGAPAIRMGSIVVPPAERLWAKKLYDAEVRFVDDNVGEITAELKSLGIFEDTMIVFASDHGEEFWEHGSFEHGHTLYEELIRVPLFIKAPGRSRGIREDGRVSTGGVYATILELCGLESDPRWLSYPSLASRLHGGSPGGDLVLSSSPLYYHDRDAWIRDSMKYIHHHGTGRMEIFDLERDPDEQHDLSPISHEKVQGAREDLTGLRQADDRLREHYLIREEPAETIDPQTLEELRSIGYVH